MFKVDEQAKKVIPAPGLRMVVSPFDEQALEAALRMRDAPGEARITVMTLGAESARARAQARAGDGRRRRRAARRSCVRGDAMRYTTARALAAAIGKLGDCDLVLTGRQAADWDAGVVGCGIAELLRLPVITFRACSQGARRSSARRARGRQRLRVDRGAFARGRDGVERAGRRAHAEPARNYARRAQAGGGLDGGGPRACRAARWVPRVRGACSSVCSCR